MSNTENPKMNLSANREVPLSLYVYIVREGSNNIPIPPQSVSIITAYTSEEATEAVARTFPAGNIITLDLKGIVPMKNVLEMFQKTIEIGSNEAVSIKTETPKIKKDYYKEIVEGMLKSIDVFLEKPEDKPALEFALKKMLNLI